LFAAIRDGSVTVAAPWQPSWLRNRLDAPLSFTILRENLNRREPPCQGVFGLLGQFYGPRGPQGGNTLLGHYLLGHYLRS
jgi:hypothetical protein